MLTEKGQVSLPKLNAAKKKSSKAAKSMRLVPYAQQPMAVAQRQSSFLQAGMPIAQATLSRFRPGLSNLNRIIVSTSVGTVLIGNGTIGANLIVYFSDIAGNIWNSAVPVLIGNSQLGSSYVADLVKHFARKIYHRVCVRFISRTTTTTNDCTVYVAPWRGGNVSPTFISTGITNSVTVSSLLGMEGVISFPSYASAELDLTPYIAGGSGAKQNEFSNNLATAMATASATTNLQVSSMSPCAFAVAGGSLNISGANATHNVMVECEISLLDFVGGFTFSQPALESSAAAAGSGRESPVLVGKSSQLHSTEASRGSGLLGFIR
jgi:hypothetical protein